MKKYKIYYQENKQLLNKVIYSSDISNESMPSNTIKVMVLSKKKNTFISMKRILLFVSKLSRVLQVNIALVSAINILKKSEKDILLKELLEELSFCLKKGNTMNIALEEYSFSHKTLILHYFKMASNKGDAKRIIKALFRLLKNINKLNETFLSTLRYPLILIFATCMCFISIFIFVVPNLEAVFSGKENLPIFTRSLFFFNEFFKDYLLFILFFIFISLFTFYYSFKQYALFRYFIDKILCRHIPILKELIYIKNMYVFFSSVRTLIKLNYEVNVAINSSLVLINNKYLLAKMSFINTDLQNGLSIEEAFRKTNVFDETSLSLLDLGQRSNNIDLIMNDLVKKYKKDFKKIVNTISVLIEPLFFFIISLLIIWIVLAVFQPIWSISEFMN